MERKTFCIKYPFINFALLIWTSQNLHTKSSRLVPDNEMSEEVLARPN